MHTKIRKMRKKMGNYHSYGIKNSQNRNGSANQLRGDQSRSSITWEYCSCLGSWWRQTCFCSCLFIVKLSNNNDIQLVIVSLIACNAQPNSLSMSKYQVLAV
ncbi:hypothetical protein ATANTOWER_029150 [Ataeniobius toweri]|uniref:Uncharacterized protein n=1 Tax=Ataeniobius toweri TaxID=208326 RepID=A0ABU7B8Z7_9TELE|nr:hypothetical protein [Ataeniobius toweri]